MNPDELLELFRLNLIETAQKDLFAQEEPYITEDEYQELLLNLKGY